MISCDRFMAEFGNYLDGEVGAEVRRQLEDHLSHCRTCWVMYDSTRKTLRVVADSSSFDLPETFSEQIVVKVMAKVRGEPRA